MVSLMATENVHGKRVISILGRSKVGSSTDKAPLNAQVKKNDRLGRVPMG